MSLDLACSTAAPAAPGISVLPGASFSNRSSRTSQGASASSGFDLVFDSQRAAEGSPVEAVEPVEPVEPVEAIEGDDSIEASEPGTLDIAGTAAAGTVATDGEVPVLQTAEDGKRFELRDDFEALVAFSQPPTVPKEPAAPTPDVKEAPETSGFEHIIPATAGDVREWIERTVTREASQQIQNLVEEAEPESVRQRVEKGADPARDADGAAAERDDPASLIASLLDKARTADSARTPVAQKIADAVSAYVNGQMAVQHGAKPDADAGASGERQGHESMGRHDRSTAARAIGTAVTPQFLMNEVSQASQAAPAPPVTPHDARLAESIVQTIRMQWFQGSGTAVMSLEPEYLGGVTVALQVEKGAVTATLHADDPNVRAWMAANEPLLRQGLAEQGLSLERLVISEEKAADAQAQAEARRRARRQPSESKPSTRRRDTSTFAVVV